MTTNLTHPAIQLRQMNPTARLTPTGNYAEIYVGTTTIVNPTSADVARMADFGHLFVVGHAGGIVTLSDEIDNFPGRVRPATTESLDDPDTSATSFEYSGATWELPLSGFTGQYSYSGPWLHNSEVIEGGVGEYVLEHPGYWVAIYGSYSPEDCAVCEGRGAVLVEGGEHDALDSHATCASCYGNGYDPDAESTIEGWTLAFKPFEVTA